MEEALPPEAVDAAARGLKRLRVDEQLARAAGEAEDGSQLGEAPCEAASRDAGAAAPPPRSPDESHEQVHHARGGSDGSGGEASVSGDDGSGGGSLDRLTGLLRRTKSLSRLGSVAGESAAGADAPALPPPPNAYDVTKFLRDQQLGDLMTMLCSDPLSWELWAFAELNVTLSANFADVASFALQPLHAYPQAPLKDALAGFLADLPRGPAARLVHILLHRTFRACAEAEIVRYRFRCPPCLSAWAKRHRVPPNAAQLFAVTGIDTTTGEGCTLYVPHMPAMQRAAKAAVSDAASGSAPDAGAAAAPGSTSGAAAAVEAASSLAAAVAPEGQGSGGDGATATQ